MWIISGTQIDLHRRATKNRTGGFAKTGLDPIVGKMAMTLPDLDKKIVHLLGVELLGCFFPNRWVSSL